MPTKHPRINVTKDTALAAALARVRPVIGDVPEATIVRDLAIRGAEALVEDETARAEAIEALVVWSTGDAIDRETLLTIDTAAWRQP